MKRPVFREECLGGRSWREQLHLGKNNRRPKKLQQYETSSSSLNSIRAMRSGRN